MEPSEALRLNLTSIFSWGFANMNTEITTFEITRAERRKLSYDKQRYNCAFLVAMNISIGIGFLLRLIGLIVKPQNANLRLFFEAAILPSTVIGCVFFLIATVRLALCWAPKANEKAVLRFDPFTQTIEISSERKTKRLKIRSFNVISSNNSIIFRGLVRQIMLPLSCLEPDKLMSFLPKATK